MRVKYFFIIITLFAKANILAQGVTFPGEPVQAPIGGLWLLVLGGFALAYKKFRK